MKETFLDLPQSHASPIRPHLGPISRRLSVPAIGFLVLPILLLAGCQTAKEYRASADKTAYDIIKSKQQDALGHSEPFTIERPSDTLRERLLVGQELPHASPASLSSSHLEPIDHWPDDDYLSSAVSDASAPWSGQGPLLITLEEALQIGARNSREYQSEKESVFRTALDLDLERDQFRNTFAGLLESLFSADGAGEGDDDVVGVEGNALLSWERRFQSGLSWTARLGLDLVKLLTLDRSSSLGLFADATISMPLLRGSGRHIVAEPLTQAERNVVYSILQFEQFKRDFAVRVAAGYLGALAAAERVHNTEENYRGLVASARRARRLADAGRLPEIQVDQAVQNELRSRDRWITAQQSHAQRMDDLKSLLGIPPDSSIELYKDELARLARTGPVIPDQIEHRGEFDSDIPPASAPILLEMPSLANAGQYEMDSAEAIRVALDNRPDLQVVEGGVYDAERAVVVAADALRPGLDLFGAASAGERRSLVSAGERDAQLRPDQGRFDALLSLDLPFERTFERNQYRDSFIRLEEAVRRYQEVEDQIKLDIQDNLRSLLATRETIMIQSRAVNLANRRVASTNLFLEAGRAQIRDLLESQEALINAQNTLITARVDYRISELSLQRHMGVLKVNEEGLWEEYVPRENVNE